MKCGNFTRSADVALFEFKKTKFNIRMEPHVLQKEPDRIVLVVVKTDVEFNGETATLRIVEFGHQLVKTAYNAMCRVSHG